MQDPEQEEQLDGWRTFFHDGSVHRQAVQDVRIGTGEVDVSEAKCSLETYDFHVRRFVDSSNNILSQTNRTN